MGSASSRACLKGTAPNWLTPKPNMSIKFRLVRRCRSRSISWPVPDKTVSSVPAPNFRVWSRTRNDDYTAVSG
eukprot:376860-Rhodomonas_salina.3